jgi:hypothetical protein
MDGIEYKKAFLRQQGFDSHTINQSNKQQINEYISRTGLCPGSNESGFYHRVNTYPDYCRVCYTNTDSGTAEYYERRAEPITPRRQTEGDIPLTPDNYQGYPQILEEEKQEKLRQQQIFQQRIKAEQEQRRRKEQDRQRIERVRAATLRDGECPIGLDSVDEMFVGKCGHGVGVKAAEDYFKRPLTQAAARRDCPTCRTKAAFSKGNRQMLTTQSGNIKRAASKLSAKAKYPGVLGRMLHERGYIKGGKRRKTRRKTRRNHKKYKKNNKSKRKRK